MQHHKRGRRWDHDGLTGDTEAIKAVRQLQGKEPTKQTSNGGHGHEGPAHRLRDLTDGSVRSPIANHDVGVQVDAVQLHCCATHQHSPSDLSIHTMRCTWGQDEDEIRKIKVYVDC